MWSRRSACSSAWGWTELPAVCWNHIAETDCVAGHIGLELRCAERKFISLRCRVSSNSGARRRRLRSRARMIFSVGAGPFPHRARRLARIANRTPSGRPASHQSSNHLTQAGRIRTSICSEWIRQLQAAPRCSNYSRPRRFNCRIHGLDRVAVKVLAGLGKLVVGDHHFLAFLRLAGGNALRPFRVYPGFVDLGGDQFD